MYISVVTFYASNERGYPMPWTRAAIVTWLLQPLIYSGEWDSVLPQVVPGDLAYWRMEQFIKLLRDNWDTYESKFRESVARNTRFVVVDVTRDQDQITLHVREVRA